MQANRENVQAACERLFSQGISIADITKKKVEELIGSKGNNQLVYQYINEWKTEKESGTTRQANSNLDPLLANYLNSVDTKWKEKLDITVEALENQLAKKTEEIQTLSEMLQKATDFKDSVEPIVKKLSEQITTGREDVINLTEQKLAVEKSNASMEAEIEHLRKSQTKQESREAANELRAKEQFFHLVESHEQQRQADSTTFQSLIDQEKNEKFTVEARLNEMQERHTQNMMVNSELRISLSNADTQIANLEESISKLTEQANHNSEHYESSIKSLREQLDTKGSQLKESEHKIKLLLAETNTRQLTIEQTNHSIGLISLMLKDILTSKVKGKGGTLDSESSENIKKLLGLLESMSDQDVPGSEND